MAKVSESPHTSFSQFLSYFPEVEPPVTLGEDTHRVFSRKNTPLPSLVIEQHLLPIEKSEVDEFTEFIPCFRLAVPTDFIILVYWRAGLMNYYYTLVTYDSRGSYIDSRIIAGSYYEEGEITRSVALLTKELDIAIASGQEQLNRMYDPGAADSTAYRLAFDDAGHIVEE